MFSAFVSTNITANLAYFPDIIYTSIRFSIHVQTIIKQNARIYHVSDTKQITHRDSAFVFRH